jgi:hypothetical protein
MRLKPQPAKPLLLLLLILAFGLKPSRTASALGGDCLYQCEGSTCYDFSNKADFCQELRAKCQARCSGQKQWGAIAYSTKDQGAGWSYGFNDLNEAKAEAMRRCAKQGTACKLWAWFENECGAVAADGDVVTWGTAYLKENAQHRALLECRKGGGKHCAIEAWVCSKL